MTVHMLNLNDFRKCTSAVESLSTNVNPGA